jgi:hypothetical protein
VSDLTESLKDILGTAYQLHFGIPIENTKDLQFSQGFGIDDQGLIKSGLEIRSLQSLKIKLFAGFDGQLYFSSYFFQGANINSLHLYMLPSEALALRLIIPEELSSPIELVYAPVDRASVETAIKGVLQGQGFSGSELAEITNGFLGEEGIGILVNSLQQFGESDGNSITIKFLDADGYILNPRYIIWTLKASLIPSDQWILDDLGLGTSSLIVTEDGFITDQNQPNGDLGPYSFIIS